jgi:hypothetical protein
MRRFSSLKYAPPATRIILRDRFSRYLPVSPRVPVQSIPADALRDEILLDLLLNLTFVFERDVDRARRTYDAALPENFDELSFDEAIAAGWMRMVWGRISASLSVAERARAVPGSNTALAALFAKRFGESFIFSDEARGDPKLNPYIAAIERGETLPGNLHCEDPAWVAARLWDRSLSDTVDPAAELRVWVDRWRLLGYPSIIPHRVWTEEAADAFRETALDVLETESSLSDWEETRSELVQQMALVSGQPPASAEPFIPKVSATFVDRALWFSDLRLERAVLESLGTHDDLFGLARLLLADVEDEDHAPAPHKIAEQLFTLALDRAELFLMLLFRVRHSPILLADLVIYPPTSALACLLVAQWQSPGSAYERELRGRDDQVTKSIAFSDAVSVLGHFLGQGSTPPAEAASLLYALHRSAKPGFIDDLEKSEAMLATLCGELASQSPDVLRAMFETLSSRMPQAGLGTSTFAAALDILDLGKLAGRIATALRLRSISRCRRIYIVGKPYKRQRSRFTGRTRAGRGSRRGAKFLRADRYCIPHCCGIGARRESIRSQRCNGPLNSRSHPSTVPRDRRFAGHRT